VIGDIGEIETRHDPPSGGVEDVRNFVLAHGFILSDENVIRPFFTECAFLRSDEGTANTLSCVMGTLIGCLDCVISALLPGRWPCCC
jgi:hypothetical protein